MSRLWVPPHVERRRLASPDELDLWMGIHPFIGPNATLTPGFFAHYDASQITGVADGAPLANWPDLSANGYNLNQNNDNPTFYKTTAAKLINGLPAVWFDGTGDNIFSGAVFSISQPVTVFMVAQLTVNASVVLFDGATNSARMTNFTSGAGGTWEWYSGSIVNTGHNVDTNLHLFTLTFNGASSTYRLDRTQIGSGSVGTNTLTGITLGSQYSATPSGFMTGPITEVVCYNSLVSVTNNETVLRNKWGTP